MYNQLAIRFIHFTNIQLICMVRDSPTATFPSLNLQIQHSKFASAISKSLSMRHIYVFFSICLRKKNAKAINFLGIFKKNMLPRIKKVYFCLKKNKKTICLIKSYFCLSHNSHDFFYISFWETKHRNNASPSLFI